MPGLIAFGWLKFGAGVAGLVLAIALLLPRPGVNGTWLTLRYHVDYQLRRASAYAARISPHGAGRGRSGQRNAEIRRFKGQHLRSSIFRRQDAS